MILKSLPQVIKVKIEKTLNGKYIAELPEYDTFTEVDNREELDFYINDLIYCIFDIPKKDQKKLWYKPRVTKPVDIRNIAVLDMFIKSRSHFNRYV